MVSINGFRRHPREDIRRRPVAERLGDWQEVYEQPDLKKIKIQGARCMDCGVPFCQSNSGCPLHNLIPEWNELIQDASEAGHADALDHKRWQEALVRLHATNNFPEFTGRLCPAPCESACVLGLNSQPVAIKSIEQTIIETGFAKGWITPQPAAVRTGRKIAIIGSGPAGLAAAQELARRGHAVTVFEKAAQVGGLLRYGIPDFKMEKNVIDRRIRQLEAEGVEFRTSTCVGTDISFTDLRTQYHAIGLAIGAERPRDLPIPGRELAGIHFAMDYLIEQNRAISGEDVSATHVHAHANVNANSTVLNAHTAINAHGKNVIIIGGGDTGSDCLGTALRQKARSVHQFEIMPTPPSERSPQTPWPQWPLQLRSSHAHEEGGKRVWSISAKRFAGEQGRVTKLIAEHVELVNGSFRKVADDKDDEAEITYDADLVILAMGFTGPQEGPLLSGLGLKRDAHGNVATDADHMTSEPGVFAAGDVRRGASLIVWAIAEGRRMAAAMHRKMR